MRSIALFFLTISSTFSLAQTSLCPQWDTAKSIGKLTARHVSEASGMVASKQFADRMYWINDSGDKGHFYYSQHDGKNLQKVKVANFKPRDTEALALTDCSEGPCLAIGDIGDNLKRRKEIKILFVREQQDYAGNATVLRQLTLQYPDGARDAEAMTFLPNGDLLIVTKEVYLMQLSAKAAGVYRLSKSELASKAKTLKLKKIGELPLPAWLPEDYFFNQVITDMAVNSTRNVLGILTYSKAFEIPLHKLEALGEVKDWKKDRDYSIVPIEALGQQESMTYLKDPDRLVWSTEQRLSDAPIFSMTCRLQVP